MKRMLHIVGFLPERRSDAATVLWLASSHLAVETGGTEKKGEIVGSRPV